MAEPRRAGSVGLDGTGMVLRVARRSVPGEQETEVADGMMIEVNQHAWIVNPPAELGGRTEARCIRLAATGREITASCERRVVASGADQLILADGITAMIASHAPHQAEEGADDDQAEDEPSARHNRHRRDDGMAPATATAVGHMACIGWMHFDIEAMRVSDHGRPLQELLR